MVEKRQKASKQRRGLPGFFQTWFRQLRLYLVTGLLVWVPLIITAWVCWVVIYRLGGSLENLIQRVLNSVNLYYYPGAGFLIVLGIFLATGFLARYYVGQRLIDLGEDLLERIPLISKIYGAIVQIRDVFIGREGAVFQHVCLIEYPRPGMFAIAFVTATERGCVQEMLEKNLLAVFVPTTPNPTSGYLVYLPPEQVKIVDMTVEDAMKMIVSGGAYIPRITDQAPAGQDGDGPQARNDQAGGDDPLKTAAP